MPRTIIRSTTVVAGALGALALATTTACGTTAGRPGAAGHSAALPPDRTRSTSKTIGGHEFDRVSDAPNALAAIERLRPLFFRPRPSFGQLRGRAPVISVFVNGSYSGNLDALRLIAPDAVASARFLQPTEAITTLGAHYAADGVIMVQLRRFKE
jgi:hypothetical protein